MQPISDVYGEVSVLTKDVLAGTSYLRRVVTAEDSTKDVLSSESVAMTMTSTTPDVAKQTVVTLQFKPRLAESTVTTSDAYAEVSVLTKDVLSSKCTAMAIASATSDVAEKTVTTLPFVGPCTVERTVDALPSIADRLPDPIVPEIVIKLAQERMEPLAEVSHAFREGATFHVRGEAYTVSKLLGKGGFGVVVSVQRHGDSAAFAAKIVPVHAEREVDALMIEILSYLKLEFGSGPRFAPEMRELGATDDGRYLVLFLERADGTLQDKISELEPPVALRMALAVAHSLRRLHSVGLLHQDLKLGNILVRDGWPLLADLGSTCEVGNWDPVQRPLSRSDTQGGVAFTLRYVAPEAAQGVVSIHSDMWSWALVFLRMLRVECNPRGSPISEHELAAMQHGVDHLFSEWPLVGELLAHCLADCPEARPASFDEILHVP